VHPFFSALKQFARTLDCRKSPVQLVGALVLDVHHLLSGEHATDGYQVYGSVCRCDQRRTNRRLADATVIQGRRNVGLHLLRKFSCACLQRP